MTNIENWRKDSGLDIISRPEEDVLKKYLQYSHNEISGADAKELDNILMVITNYYVFLKSQVGIISARVVFLEDQISAKINSSVKYTNLTYLNKKGKLISEDAKLTELSSKLTEEKVKLSMIEPFSDAIKIKIDSIKKIFDRRIRDKYVN